MTELSGETDSAFDEDFLEEEAEKVSVHTQTTDFHVHALGQASVSSTEGHADTSSIGGKPFKGDHEEPDEPPAAASQPEQEQPPVDIAESSADEEQTSAGAPPVVPPKNSVPISSGEDPDDSEDKDHVSPPENIQPDSPTSEGKNKTPENLSDSPDASEYFAEADEMAEHYQALDKLRTDKSWGREGDRVLRIEEVPAKAHDLLEAMHHKMQGWQHREMRPIDGNATLVLYAGRETATALESNHYTVRLIYKNNEDGTMARLPAFGEVEVDIPPDLAKRRSGLYEYYCSASTGYGVTRPHVSYVDYPFQHDAGLSPQMDSTFVVRKALLVVDALPKRQPRLRND